MPDEQEKKHQLELPQFPLLTSGTPEKPSAPPLAQSPAARAPEPTPSLPPHALAGIGPLTSSRRRMNPLLAVGVVAVVACLLLIIFLFLSLKSGDILPPTAQTVPSEQATLPAEAPTTTANENLTRQHDYATGDTVQLYAHDLIAVHDAKNPNRSYRVLAAEFMDSRCPTGRTCIWAGERAVLLTVTDLIADKTEDLRLGQRITPSGEVMGLRCTLLGFSDATGTYAEIKFE